MYGSYQRVLAESARMQIEARKAKPVTRDQSEDRGPVKAIVFGKETSVGVCYGVKDQAGEVIMPAEYTARDATACALAIDAQA